LQPVKGLLKAPKMRSIQARFKKEERKNPYLGACINLAKAVRGQKFSHRILVKAFKKLVPVEEYAKSETNQIIRWLEFITNTPEESRIGVKMPKERVENNK
jgi:hypothetical protein